ncbi:MFS transporter [Geochorda subterranea]|uniref:MFS transporter n=1 Tax=Geochorda subterranea TaxID=3109564 RepID=A0ABZ1BQH4_9FIRM|nr:MFS transporter [Limnochorda sp. LNt]WRP14888.1 MFS transporter [Limnochorda sp. LNt]
MSSESRLPEPHPRRWQILSAIAIGTLMGPVDGSVVNIALPVITQRFGTTLAMAEWIAMAYLLVISSVLLTWGRLGDMYGHRRIYLGGFAVFTLGSLLCGAAGGIGWLVAFRVVQALGAGMMLASGPAIITEVFAPTERGRALGLNAVAVAVGLSIGPVLGGFLVEHLGWRSIFYINLPIGLVGIAWAYRVLPPPTAVRPAAFDVPGALTLFGALFSLLLALSQGEIWGWRAPATLALAALGVVGLLVFVAVERRAAAPMVDLSLFDNRVFVLANASALTNFMAQFSVTFLMPFFLQFALGMPPDRAGTVMLGLPAAMMVVAPLAGYLSDRFGSRWPAVTGMTILAAGIVSMSQLDAGASGSGIFWRLAVLGLGAGLFQTPNNSAIMGSVPRDRLGIAGGMLASMRNIGMVLGIGVSGAVFMATAGGRPELAAADLDLFLSGMHAAMSTGAAFALLGAVAAWAARTSSSGPGRRAWRERAAPAQQ